MVMRGRMTWAFAASMRVGSVASVNRSLALSAGIGHH